MSSTSANCCQLIPRNRATVFPALGQLAAAELTHHSLKPLRLPYSSRLRLSLLLAGDIHPNPGPATQYPCAVCTSNVTSRGVSFKCNQCSGWVHSKCSGLKNAAQYRKTKDWACSSCNSPPTPSQPQAPPPPTPMATRSMNLVRHEIFPEFSGIPEFLRPQRSFSWKSQIRFNIYGGGGGGR